MNFEVKTLPLYTIIKCNVDLEEQSTSNELIAIMRQTLQGPLGGGVAIIIDLIKQYNFTHIFLKEVAQVTKYIRQNSGKLLVANAPLITQRLIKEMGMDGSIQIAPSLEKAIEIVDPAQPVSKPSAKVDVNFINPFIEGMLLTLKVQCSTEAIPGKPFLKGTGENLDIAIAASLGLTSSVFKGSITLCFSEKTFLSIMGRMLGETYTNITKDLEDGAGELLNIIFGSAKKTLNEKGYAVEKAIPTIIRGQDLKVSHMTPRPAIVLPFATDSGSIHIEIATDAESLIV